MPMAKAADDDREGDGSACALLVFGVAFCI